MKNYLRLFLALGIVSSPLIFADEGPSGSVEQVGQEDDKQSSSSSREEDSGSSIWGNIWNCSGTALSLGIAGAKLIPAQAYFAGMTLLAAGWGVRKWQHRNAEIERLKIKNEEARRRVQQEKEKRHQQELEVNRTFGWQVGQEIGGLQTLVEVHDSRISEAEQKLNRYKQSWKEKHVLLKANVLSNTQAIEGLRARTLRLEEENKTLVAMLEQHDQRLKALEASK